MAAEPLPRSDGPEEPPTYDGRRILILETVMTVPEAHDLFVTLERALAAFGL